MRVLMTYLCISEPSSQAGSMDAHPQEAKPVDNESLHIRIVICENNYIRSNSDRPG